MDWNLFALSYTDRSSKNKRRLRRVALLAAGLLLLSSCQTRVNRENESTESTSTPSTQQNPTYQIPTQTPTFQIPNNTTPTIDTGTGTVPTTVPVQALTCELHREGGVFWVGQPIYWYVTTNTNEALVVEQITLNHTWSWAELAFFDTAIGAAFYTPGEKWLQFYFRSALDASRRCNGGAPIVDYLFINGYGY